MKCILSVVVILLWVTAAWSGMQAPRKLVVAGGGGGGPYSDNFNDTDNTLLATHNSAWASPGSTYLVSNAKILGNVVYPTANFVDFGAYHQTSTSDTSQIVYKAQGFANNGRRLGVRMGSSNTGYTILFDYAPGDSFQLVNFYKNGSAFATNVSLSTPMTWGADHTVKLVASGTSTVMLTLYIDGSKVASAEDTSSTITSGHPGFLAEVINTDGTTFDNWSDS